VTAKRWLLLVGGLVVLVAAVLAIVASRIEPRLRRDVERALAKRLDSVVTLERFDVSLFPRPAIVGKGLVIRHRGRTDLPPLITITSFTGHTGWEGLYSRHITEVTLDGLEVTIPPQRRADMPSLSGDSSSGDGEDASDGDSGPPFSIGTVTATNARLSIMPKRVDKDPRIFDIYTVSIYDLTFVSPSTFVASLTNPIPEGLIETNGAFGPWNRDEPSETPVEGRYVFNADLGTVKGIAGAVSAQGQFNGVVNRIATTGTTKTPDFRLPKLKASALALQTTYRAVVDGTNGDVQLEHVDVNLGESTFVAKGFIVGTKGIKGKRVLLDVTSQKALMPDILRLTVRTLPPAMTGMVRLKASFDLPQGPVDVLDKLRLEGQVAVNGARFTTPTVQDKVDELSSRGLGRPKDPAIDNVQSRINTTFSLKGGVLTLKSLGYVVPGADITMSGTYNLESGALNFAGAARLVASVSQTQTGYRRFLLKPFDPLFRKKGAGARVAIDVAGTVDQPKIGLDLKRTLKGQ
jgi:hypothetical protein